jgi:hypothetical protein
MLLPYHWALMLDGQLEAALQQQLCAPVLVQAPMWCGCRA